LGLVAAFLYGTLQGLTEFLPVSSSGHLAYAAQLMHLETGGLGLAVATHVGTLVAVLWFYRRTIADLVAVPTPDRGRRLGAFAWALLATAPMALLLAAPAETAFSQPSLVAAGFLLTSVLLWLMARLPLGGRGSPAAIDGILIGAAQGIAVWPGLSRSGATIATARLLGIAPDAAAEFTFLLSVPTVLAALGRELYRGGLGGATWAQLLLAAAAAAVVGTLGLRWLVGLLRAGRVSLFALYTLALAGVGLWLG
jgi:undecaprenyl-diphosphatase